MNYKFSQPASKGFLKLEKQLQKRILIKLDFYSRDENFLEFAEHLTDSKVGQYRFRIGDYRVIFDIEENVIRILKVAHRREIYK